MTTEAKPKEDPKEVQEMRRQLAEQRRAARGVKESARGMRAIPKSDRLAQLTDADMREYDSTNPPMPPSSVDDTVRRVPG